MQTLNANAHGVPFRGPRIAALHSPDWSVIANPTTCLVETISLFTPGSFIFYRFKNFFDVMLTRIYICFGMFSSLCQQDDDFEYWREIQDNKSIKVVLQKIF